MDNFIFLVRVSCDTYNHASFIEDAMSGFTMQQTTFPFICTIIDDASTDGTPDVIKQYMSKFFDLEDKSVVFREETDDYLLIFARHKVNHNCFFAVLLLKYNHYSIGKPKTPYISRWKNTKYIAICEGDDYWIDPRKLQLQSDYLNLHPSYSMCWHDAVCIDAITGHHCGDHRRYKRDTTSPLEDIILQGGGFCPTASIFYVNEIRSHAPDSLFSYHIGDYPLQLYLAFNGDVRYIDKPMSIYRTHVPGSWTASVASNSNLEERRALWSKTLRLIDDFNKYSYYKYDKLFEQRKCLYLFYEYFAVGDYSLARKYWYRCKSSLRPRSLGLVLSIHGFSPLVRLFKECFSNQRLK